MSKLTLTDALLVEALLQSPLWQTRATTVAAIRAREWHSDTSRIVLVSSGVATPYRYDSASVAADNGTTVLKPDNVVVTDPGRWLEDSASLHGHAATEISVDTTNFDKNLSAADDTVQKALETIDELVTGGGSTPEDGTITRDGDGYVSSIALETKTITVTRSSGLISQITDGTTTWAFTRDANGYIASWGVTP